MNRLLWLIGALLCSLLRHPPSTWGKREWEDSILRMIHTPMPSGTAVTVHVNCLCGRKTVPFRARRLEGGPP